MLTWNDCTWSLDLGPWREFQKAYRINCKLRYYFRTCWLRRSYWELRHGWANSSLDNNRRQMSDSFDHSPPAASQPPYFRVPHSIKSSHILVGIADFGLEKDISPCSMCGRRDFSAAAAEVSGLVRRMTWKRSRTYSARATGAARAVARARAAWAITSSNRRIRMGKVAKVATVRGEVSKDEPGGHFGRWRLFVERNFRLFDLVVL